MIETAGSCRRPPAGHHLFRPTVVYVRDTVITLAPFRSEQVVFHRRREGCREAQEAPFADKADYLVESGAFDPKDMSTGFLLGMVPAFLPDGCAVDLTAGGADRRRADRWWG